MTRPREGDTHRFERSFTPEEVRQFADLSGDEQSRHLEPDDEGRLLVHGLLTATMPTKIGGELEVLGRSMAFDFHRPVYTGETLTCEMEIDTVSVRDDHYELEGSVTCWNDSDEDVMTGSVEGLVWK
ncbi:FAS1-like dehydratase domain-containing protein [Halorussus ruber]|uniref:FAS1-like dehydratase domain-containing protein n=1 Tax=Halorussus ruber TaxID=1126238 RepID=UPI0010920CD3|nr:MaoC family dehydratase N-terminal domain-containing protein [Halorussus ruber]